MSVPQKPLGVILAGGLATRMGGGDKGALPLGDATVLDYVIARLRPQVQGLVLNANGDPARFERYGLPVIADTFEGFAGPLAGVLAGLEYAVEHGCNSIVTAAADTPFFPVDLVSGLQEASTGMTHPLALAATPHANPRKARHPTFGIWPTALRTDLRAALQAGVRKVVQWSDGHNGQLALFSQEAAFFNVNTPEDLERAEAML